MTAQATRAVEVTDLYRVTRESWGGATVDMQTGAPADVSGDDTYAAAITTTISIPEDTDLDTFARAVAAAREQFAGAPYLGVFHDDARHTVDLDGVVITTRAGVDELYRAGYPIAGGAYHFATGDGYWPSGVTSQEYADSAAAHD